MSEEFDALVWRCLEELEHGVALETILSQHPQQAAELRPILQVAAGLHTLAARPPAHAQSMAQEQFLIHAAAMRQVARPRAAWWRRLGLALASLAVLLVTIFSLVQGSAEAVPGDALYPVKRARENMRLALTADPAAATVLRHEFNAERAAEIKTLLTIGRHEEVECEADIEDLRDGVIEVYGLDFHLTDATIVNGPLQVGRTIKVIGYTADGRLFATNIEVEAEEEEEGRHDSAVPTRNPLGSPASDTPDAMTPGALTPEPAEHDDAADDDPHTPIAPTRDHQDDSDEADDDHRATSAPVTPTPNAPPDNSGSGSDHSGDDNSDSGNDHSGDDNSDSGNDHSGDDNSDSGDDNSDSGNDHSGDDNSNSGDDNSGSGRDDSDDDDNSGREGSDAGRDS